MRLEPLDFRPAGAPVQPVVEVLVRAAVSESES